MRYLNKIIFINSAHVPYAEIKLDGNVHFIGSRRCIGSGSAAMCPWCRCSASRKHDIAVLIAIVRTAEIKPPVYQFAQSSAPKFVHRMKISTIGNNTQRAVEAPLKHV